MASNSCFPSRAKPDVGGATSVTGVGPGMSNGKYKGWLTAGCGGKGQKPTPCGGFSCAFSDGFELNCNCEIKHKRGCVTNIRVGQQSRIKIGTQSNIRVC